MAHTYTNLIFHIVFRTQGSLPLITTDRKQELFAYIAGLVKEKGGRAIVINGMPDHVHLLIVLPPDVSVSDALKFLKANSSRWMKQRFKVAFAWQKGFGAFSVSRSNIDAVAKYIRDQEQHHEKFDLEREFVLLLEKNGIEFDPEFLGR
jgi:putative transposase